MLNSNGPMLIASNHPNSFLDAIIVSALFKKPVYSLARGDAFGRPFFAKLLRSLKILPVYRASEGSENLEHNYKTFDECKNIFRQNGIVFIASEGRCINEWHLRPLKKGTARLAISSWQDGIPLQVLPLGINYSSFHTFGKNIIFNIGDIITADQVGIDISPGKSLLNFNALLLRQLQQLVFEIDSNNEAAIKEKFTVKRSLLKKILLLIPAIIGYIIHAPLYLPIKKLAWAKAGHNDHFDSVVTGILFLLYPIYLVLLSVVVDIFIPGYWWATVFVIFPFCAWSYIQLKHQFEY